MIHYRPAKFVSLLNSAVLCFSAQIRPAHRIVICQLCPVTLQESIPHVTLCARQHPKSKDSPNYDPTSNQPLPRHVHRIPHVRFTGRPIRFPLSPAQEHHTPERTVNASLTSDYLNPRLPLIVLGVAGERENLESCATSRFNAFPDFPISSYSPNPKTPRNRLCARL